jgi:hypothetical protein
VWPRGGPPLAPPTINLKTETLGWNGAQLGKADSQTLGPFKRTLNLHGYSLHELQPGLPMLFVNVIFTGVSQNFVNEGNLNSVTFLNRAFQAVFSVNSTALEGESNVCGNHSIYSSVSQV